MRRRSTATGRDPRRRAGHTRAASSTDRVAAARRLVQPCKARGSSEELAARPRVARRRAVDGAGARDELAHLAAVLGLLLERELAVALLEGDAPVTSTSALKLERDVYLEDDGTELPLGSCAYTVEMWIRFDGQHSCFFGWGHEPNNGCIGAHFDGGFNHFWYANDLHCGGDQGVPGRWMHLVLRGDPEANKRVILIDGKQIGEDQPGEHDTDAAFWAPLSDVQHADTQQAAQHRFRRDAPERAAARGSLVCHRQRLPAAP